MLIDFLHCWKSASKQAINIFYQKYSSKCTLQEETPKQITSLMFMKIEVSRTLDIFRLGNGSPIPHRPTRLTPDTCQPMGSPQAQTLGIMHHQMQYLSL